MNTITIINTSYHKKLTDTHLAQINFTARMPKELFQKYINKTNIDKQSLGRIRFMEPLEADIESDTLLVFGRVSHGYGYSIDQDIENSITESKGVIK